MITWAFAINLDDQFSPMQLLYAGKSKGSIPKVDFSKEISQDIIIPYMRKEGGWLGLDIYLPDMLIMDVLRGQTTPTIWNSLASNDIRFSKVPANMTNLYQPLNFTVNGYNSITKWHQSRVKI